MGGVVVVQVQVVVVKSGGPPRPCISNCTASEFCLPSCRAAAEHWGGIWVFRPPGFGPAACDMRTQRDAVCAPSGHVSVRQC